MIGLAAMLGLLLLGVGTEDPGAAVAGVAATAATAAEPAAAGVPGKAAAANPSRPVAAGCAPRCAEAVRRALEAVRRELGRYVMPPTPVPPRVGHGGAGPGHPAAPAPYPGRATACVAPDPTRSGGCLTSATRYGLDAAATAFGGLRNGPVVRSSGCWDAHAWNPTSDHSRGRACDLFPTAAGTFPTGAELANGWRIAEWFRANAEALHVKYVIWQGRLWDPQLGDAAGWGCRYTGGGIYDVRTATGGHFDHVHVSFAE